MRVARFICTLHSGENFSYPIWYSYKKAALNLEKYIGKKPTDSINEPSAKAVHNWSRFWEMVKL